jgi:hypothetical protein
MSKHQDISSNAIGIRRLGPTAIGVAAGCVIAAFGFAGDATAAQGGGGQTGSQNR